MKIQTYYDQKTRFAIAKDLLKKHPTARMGLDAVGMSAENEYRWCNRYQKYRDLYTSNKTYWGYTREQILMMGCTSESDVRELVSSMLSAKGKWTEGAQTRRTNRLMDRVFEGIFSDNRRGKTAGVYSVSEGYHCQLGAVAAQNEDHARQIATVMYQSIIDIDRMRLNRVGDLTKENMLKAIGDSDVSPASIENRKARAKEDYQRKCAELDALAAKGSYAQLLGLQALEELEELDAE